MIIETTNIINEKLKNKKSILQFIPKNLQDLINNRDIIQFDKKRLKTSYLVDITHSLLLKYFTTLKQGIGETNFNLSALILREKYGNDYSFYMKFLIENGIIRLSSDYLVGKKTKTYSLTEYTLKSDVFRYSNRNSKIIQRYINNVLSVQVVKSNQSWIEPSIKSKLVEDLFSVSINNEMAINIVNSYKEDKDIFNKNLYSVECIRDGHIFYNFDNYGRMHSNFTILKSKIRTECLLIDDEEVSEIDIKNSQPMFLTLLLSKNLNFIKDKEEYEFFKRSVINGTLYKYFMDECDIENRKQVKELIYKVFFGRNSNDYENKMFKKLFPCIYSFIKKYKVDNGDYRSLAYYLQRSESNLLFNNIIKHIILIEPEIKLFTIHDSICFPVRYRETVERIFNSEINKLFNG